jgi:hypothetical protein
MPRIPRTFVAPQSLDVDAHHRSQQRAHRATREDVSIVGI